MTVFNFGGFGRLNHQQFIFYECVRLWKGFCVSKKANEQRERDQALAGPGTADLPNGRERPKARMWFR